MGSITTGTVECVGLVACSSVTGTVGCVGLVVGTSRLVL